MERYYEVVGKSDYGWETIKLDIKTKTEAIKIARQQDKKKWEIIDINLIVDDDLTETYDKNGKIR